MNKEYSISKASVEDIEPIKAILFKAFKEVETSPGHDLVFEKRL